MMDNNDIASNIEARVNATHDNMVNMLWVLWYSIIAFFAPAGKLWDVFWNSVLDRVRVNHVLSLYNSGFPPLLVYLYLTSDQQWTLTFFDGVTLFGFFDLQWWYLPLLGVLCNYASAYGKTPQAFIFSTSLFFVYNFTLAYSLIYSDISPLAMTNVVFSLTGGLLALVAIKGRFERVAIRAELNETSVMVSSIANVNAQLTEENARLKEDNLRLIFQIEQSKNIQAE